MTSILVARQRSTFKVPKTRATPKRLDCSNGQNVKHGFLKVNGKLNYMEGAIGTQLLQQTTTYRRTDGQNISRIRYQYYAKLCIRRNEIVYIRYENIVNNIVFRVANSGIKEIYWPKCMGSHKILYLILLRLTDIQGVH